MLAQRKIWSLAAILGLIIVTSAQAAPIPEPRAVTTDDTKWLLPNAEAFLKFNFKQLLSADLMTKGGTATLKDAIKKNEHLKSVLEAAEIDPTRDIDSLMASASGSSAKDAKALVVLRGKFNQTKVHDAIKKNAEKNEKLKLSKEGTINLYEIVAQDNSMFAAFADNKTIVLTQSKDATVEAVKNGGRKAVAISKEMQGALSKFTGKESMAMALVVNDDLKKALGDIPNVGAAAAKVKTVTASITLSDIVVVHAAGNTGEPRSAKQLSNVLEALKAAGAAAVGGMDNLPPILGDILDAIKISAGKDAVRLDLKVDKDMIQKAGKGGK